MTEIQITPAYRDVKPLGYYVYIHRKASNGEVFNVGKGKERRAWSACSRSKLWLNTARKHGVTVEIIRLFQNENCAFTFEKIQISKYIFLGVKLVNLTSGGEGASGAKRTKEAMEKTALALGIEVYCSNGMKFQSYADAARWCREEGTIKASDCKISMCARGLRLSAYGFAWSNTSIPHPPEFLGRMATVNGIKKHRSKPVVCSNGMVFNSVREASDWVSEFSNAKNPQSSISFCLTGRYKKAYGLGWSYWR